MPGGRKKGDPTHHRRGNGAGKGDGWGGPAKGEGNRRPGPGRGHIAPGAVPREERLALLRDHIWTLALTAAREETQLAAANAYLDREEGKPIARTVTATVDDVSQLSDLELAAEIARIDRELAAAKAGTGEAAPREPAGTVPPLH